MTNPSPTQAPATPSPTDLIIKALPAIEWLAENTDCPALPGWVTIDPNGNGKIREISDYEIWVHNPPAVLAAICVWVNGEVVPWYEINTNIWVIEPFHYSGVFGWEITGPHYGDTGDENSTYPEATIALLLAIVECLKGGG